MGDLKSARICKLKLKGGTSSSPSIPLTKTLVEKNNLRELTGITVSNPYALTPITCPLFEGSAKTAFCVFLRQK
jgi:hypothetical protein